LLGIDPGRGTPLPGTQSAIYGAVANGVIEFSVSQPARYSVTGSLAGVGLQGSPYTFTAAIWLQQANELRYLWNDLGASTAAAFSYSFSPTGILPPGSYRFTYELRLEDFSGQ
jgi:hypothetical protein